MNELALAPASGANPSGSACWRVGDFIQRVGCVFKFASDTELMAAPMRFGPGFDRASNPQRGDPMPDEAQAPTRLPSDAQPHAVEVRDAQAVADGAGTGGRAVAGGDVAADLELLRGLVAAYGADGVRRMIDALKYAAGTDSPEHPPDAAFGGVERLWETSSRRRHFF